MHDVLYVNQFLVKFVYVFFCIAVPKLLFLSRYHLLYKG